jgi:hypothetical protein
MTIMPHNKFPIYYRPNTIMYSKLNPSTPLGSSATAVEVSNISDVYKGIKLNPCIKRWLWFDLRKRIKLESQELRKNL